MIDPAGEQGERETLDGGGGLHQWGIYNADVMKSLNKIKNEDIQKWDKYSKLNMFVMVNLKCQLDGI